MDLRFSWIKKSALYIGKKHAVKLARLHPYEMNLIHNHPNVFIQTKSLGNWVHIMPSGTPLFPGFGASIIYADAFNILRSDLWGSVPLGRNSHWKKLLLEHITRIYPSAKLLDRIQALDPGMGTDRIHGDATMANVVSLEIKPHRFMARWTDPCWRPYLPADRRVDVAKGMQSAWNFEGVVSLNQKPFFIPRLAEAIKTASEMTSSDDEVINTWSLVHIARLLRYQTLRVSKLFTEVLVDYYGCKL
jgi:hypothetical protein